MSRQYGSVQHPGFTSPEIGRAPTLPSMFPCANRVKMPQIGANETSLKPQVVISLEKPVLIPPRLPVEVSDAYVKTISSDLTFTEDVVKHRSFHTLPYDQKYFREVLDISHLVKPPEKTKFTMARHNTRGTDKRHAPCHIQKRSTHKLKPIRRKILEKAQQMQKEENEYRAQQAAQTPVTCTEDSRTTVSDPFFFTEVETTAPTEAVTESQLATRHQWDEYLLSIVSDGTAHWIANHQTEATYNQDRLKTFLKDRCGSLDQRAELIKDTASEPDVDLERGKTASTGQKKWKRPDENLLDRVRQIMGSSEKTRDPYDDNTDAAFYRLPAGFRRAKKQIDKEEDAACNNTAFNIEVKRYVPPPLPTIRDSFNPRLRDKLYDTDNEFQKDWLTGAEHQYERSAEQDRIITDTGNKYKKELVKESPAKPEKWFPLSAREVKKREKDEKKVKVIPKGMHRWRALPEPVDEVTGKILPPPADDPFAIATTGPKGFDRTMNPPGTDTLMDSMTDSAAPKMMRTKNTLTMMVNDWRSRWHLDMRYADATPDDLIRDMADLHTHIKLKAITTCARAAEYKPPPEPGIQLSNEPEVDYIKLLPENLFVALECCLDDTHEQVRLAAAIALYTLERPVPKAETILREILYQEGGSDDKWTAAQCLAYYGECDSSVVGELIKQLLEADDLMRHEQAATLLSTLSEGSTLVHCMVGEQLNSSSWRHRVMAIKTIPKLQGHINKDLVHKLTHLMWFDWHNEVRKAAAQALGKTGHGKDVHDDLIDKIKNGSEKTRVEAVSKVGHLGIMTAKLIPIFLNCFHDSYVSVRMEACIACSNLHIKDPIVLEKLVFCATFDPIWKIKALAIQAMGVIGEIPENVRECILWAFRFEEQDGVRAEACHSIRMLKMKDEEVAQILQDRYLVESSDVVRDELLKALEMFGISPTEDMNMVAQVKGEVRKLCTKMNISAQICVNEKEDRDRENVQRMIVQPQPAPQKPVEVPETRHRPFSQASHASTGYVHSSRLPIVDMRPYSRESSVVDREIQDIFEKAKRGSLTPETMSRPTTASKSRPTTAQSSKSRKTEPISELDEDDLEDDVDDVIEESARTEDSAAKEVAPLASGKASRAQEEDATAKPARASPLFTDEQTYVELTGKEGMDGDSSRDVVKIEHGNEGEGHKQVPNQDKVEISTNAGSELTSDMDSFSLGGSNLHLNEIPAQGDEGSTVQQDTTEPTARSMITQSSLTQESIAENPNTQDTVTSPTEEKSQAQDTVTSQNAAEKPVHRPPTRELSDLGSIKEEQ